MRVVCAALLLLGLTGCATNPRFVDSPVVWEIDDKTTIEEPAEEEFFIRTYLGDVLVFDRAMRALSLHDREPAHNVNSLGGVPNSSWFTNRIGMFDISPRRVAQGPTEQGPPRAPFQIVRGKSGGGNPGFIVKDADGRTFLVKFDRPENPEMQTGTNVIVNRVFWAAGYNVPNDYVFWFDPAELSIGQEAEIEAPDGTKLAFEPATLKAILGQVPREPDGRYRATASEYLEGIPKGGFRAVGTRPDDPNDKIPHQHRRELRGLRVVSAWLNHTDMKNDNTLDMYVEENGRRFLKHYLVDFGEALGAHQAEKQRLDDGYEYVVDWSRNGMAMLALGLWIRPWEGQKETGWPAVGAFGADHFDPNYWREAYPYQPFAEATDEDLYWGANIVTRFSDEHIRAIVRAARFSAAGVEDYLVDALIRRRDAIGRAWLNTVTPLEEFSIRDGRLCMVDVAVERGYARPTPVDQLDGSTVVARHQTDGAGNVCIPVPDRSYAIIRLRTVRNGEARPPMQVHVRGGSEPDVLGIVRIDR